MSQVTVAVSEAAFKELFAAIRDAIHFADSNSSSFSGFTAGYSVAAHLEGGTVDLRSNGTVSIKELDVKWDVLQVFVGFDIPEWCIQAGASSRTRFHSGRIVCWGSLRSASSAPTPTSRSPWI